MSMSIDPKKVVAKIGIQADGDIAWVDYTDGPYLTEPLVDFSMPEEIVFADEKWNVTALMNVTTYAFLQLRRSDGSIMFCAIKTPRWW